MSFVQATQWNNGAIASLQRGDVKSAIQRLKMSLAVMVNESDRGSVGEPQQGIGGPPLTSSAAAIIRSAPVLGANNPFSEAIASNSANDDVFVLYPRVFEILAPEQSEVGELGFHQSLVAILYNLAFAYDTLALAKDGIPEFLSKCNGCRALATKLYRSALEVASGKPELASTKYAGCLLLAASNNLGRLSQTYEDTKDCLRTSLDFFVTQDLGTASVGEDELLYASIAPFLCVKDFLLPTSPAA